MEVGAAEGGAGSQEPVQAVAASVATGADGMVKKRRLARRRSGTQGTHRCWSCTGVPPVRGVH